MPILAADLEVKISTNLTDFDQKMARVDTRVKQTADNLNRPVQVNININEAEKSLKKVETQHTSLVSKLGQSMKLGVVQSLGGMGGMLGTIASGNPVTALLSTGLSGLGGVMSSVVTKGMEFNSQMTHMREMLTGLGEDGAKAEASLAKLKAIAVDRAISFEPLAQGVERLKAMGVESGKAVQYMSGIATVSRALGGGAEMVEKISSAFELLADREEAAGTQLLRLDRQGVPIIKTLMEMSGRSAEQVQNLLKKGVDAPAIMKSLSEGWQRSLGGVADERSHSGSAESERTNILLAMRGADATQSFQKHLKELYSKINEGLGSDTAEGFAKGIDAATDKMFTVLEAGLTNVIKGVGDATADAAAAAGDRTGQVFADHLNNAAAQGMSRITGLSERVTNPLVRSFGLGQALDLGGALYDQRGRISDFLQLNKQAYQFWKGKIGGQQLHFASGMPQLTFASMVGGGGNPVSDEIMQLVKEAADTFNLPVELILAMMRQESGGHRNATSPKGAGGLMQMMPDTFRRFHVAGTSDNRYDPRANVFAGVNYMSYLLDMFGGNLQLALAGYNAGEGAVQKYRGIPPYQETRQYVRAISADYSRRLRNGVSFGGGIGAGGDTGGSLSFGGIAAGGDLGGSLGALSKSGITPVYVVNSGANLGGPLSFGKIPPSLLWAYSGANLGGPLSFGNTAGGNLGGSLGALSGGPFASAPKNQAASLFLNSLDFTPFTAFIKEIKTDLPQINLSTKEMDQIWESWKKKLGDLAQQFKAAADNIPKLSDGLKSFALTVPQSISQGLLQAFKQGGSFGQVAQNIAYNIFTSFADGFAKIFENQMTALLDQIFANIIGNMQASQASGGGIFGSLVSGILHAFSPLGSEANPYPTQWNARGGLVRHFDTGGSVFGPGTSTSDSIPSYLSNGEFVTNAAATSYYGVQFMNDINQMRYPRGGASSGQGNVTIHAPIHIHVHTPTGQVPKPTMDQMGANLLSHMQRLYRRGNYT